MLRKSRVVLLLVAVLPLLAQKGVVKSANQPIPGATVTLTQAGKKMVTSTDENGRYEVSGLEPGAYSIDVTMFGFKTSQRTFEGNTGADAVEWTLELQPRQTLTQRRPQIGGSVQLTQAATEIDTALQATPAPDTSGTPAGNEAFLLSGSISQGLQTGQADALAQQGPGFGRPDGQFGGPGGLAGPGAGPGGPAIPGFGGAAGGGGGRGGGGGGFGGPGGPGGFGGGGGRGGGGPGQRQRPGGPGGQPGQFFGNRTNRGRDGLHGGANFSLDNSIADARPFSFTGASVPRASYDQARFGFVAGGALRFEKLKIKSDSTFFFINYNGSRAKNPFYNVATLPTPLERGGDFSQSHTNVPIAVYDPTNGSPFPNNIIPASRFNPAVVGTSTVKGLLGFIPLPNNPASIQNYQILTSVPRNSDAVNIRLNQNVTKKDRLSLTFNLQNNNGEPAQLFGWRDTTSGTGMNANLSYTRNLGQRTLSVARIVFSRNRSDTVPYFANKNDVASQLGIRGASTDPLNYGPPNLSFTNFGGLSDASAFASRVQSIDSNETVSFVKGKHNLSGGFDFKRSQINNKTDSNGRGTFSFSGIETSALDSKGQPISGTGYDFADFLLGLPQSSSVRFGTASTYFRGNTWAAFGQDDWRVKSNFSINLGLRWEYYSPLTEKYGHEANLNVAPGFTGVTVVTPGALDGLPNSLIRPDKHGLAPRVGIAWKPLKDKSTQIRMSYGIYYNGTVYNSIAARMASQPPFGQTTTLNTSLANQLTLQNGLTTTVPGKVITNTFAVDPDYLVGYAQTWSGSIQHDLPRNIIVELSYLGTKGTRLDIQRLPNRAAPGSPLTAEQRLAIGNAVGFTYESSDGNSIYHSLQTRVTRRFRRGFSLNVNYVFSKSIDNSSTFGGGGNTVAQNDLDLRAERGLSSFDQRHVVTSNWVWSSPNTKSRLWQNWTISGSFRASSGTPLTARVLGNLSDSGGTGAVGSGRAQATGLDVVGGQFFNLAAFTIPIGGQYGNAGRNTIPGPSQYSMSASVRRSFSLGERRRLEFGVDSTNVTNHVSYTNLSTVVNASDYGLPTAASGMRTVQASVRFRF